MERVCARLTEPVVEGKTQQWLAQRDDVSPSARPRKIRVEAVRLLVLLKA